MRRAGAGHRPHAGALTAWVGDEGSPLPIEVLQDAKPPLFEAHDLLALSACGDDRHGRGKRFTSIGCGRRGRRPATAPISPMAGRIAGIPFREAHHKCSAVKLAEEARLPLSSCRSTRCRGSTRGSTHAFSTCRVDASVPAADLCGTAPARVREQIARRTGAGALMTVCIAPRGKGGIALPIGGYAGDVQFQPRRRNRRSPRDVAMTAGELAPVDIMVGVTADVRLRWRGDRINGSLSGDRRSLLRPLAGETPSRRACDIKPLGLTTSNSSRPCRWIPSRSRSFPTLSSLRAPGTACLVTGIDATGPHIFAIYDGVPMQADSVGFAAIGIGGRHAESQLMLAQYAPDLPAAAAMMLVHLAKSRAEVAPGVGPDTDMFVIGPELGTYGAVPENVMALSART